MLYNVYAIQDVLVGFHAPMIAPNDESMARDYKSWANGKTREQAADLRLFKVGTFDDQTGEIKGITPECMIGGLDNGNE